MTETAADEQDLAKALDSVASAASSLDGTSSLQSSNPSSALGTDLPPIILPNSPVAPVSTPATSTFPPITPVHDSNDRPNDQMATSNPVSEPSADATTPTDDGVVTHTDTVVKTDNSSPADDVVASGPLADIKKDALDELRPLVDKLDVSAEEKFDTYLLLIRSTDDTNLVGPAHEAAKAINDEAKRAEALLEIIKEIDYLSRKK